METEKYFYIINKIHRNYNHGFEIFETLEDAKKHILENQGTYVYDKSDLERDPKNKFVLYKYKEDEKNKVTYSNLLYIKDNGRFEFIEYTDDDELEQPVFFESVDAEKLGEYTEFYYYAEDGKYYDAYDEYDTEEELKMDYYNLYTV